MEAGWSEVRFFRPRRSLGRLAVGVAIVLALSASVFVLPVARGQSNPDGWVPVPSEWGNGIVLCTFSSSQPAAAVSAESLNGTGLGAGPVGLQEVSPSGSVVASAAFSSVNWFELNNSHDAWFDMTYTAQVPVVSTGSTTPAGAVSVRVDFVLPAYAEKPGQNLTVVNLTLSLSNWPWQHSTDVLRASLQVWMPFPAAERLSAGIGGGSVVTTSSASTGRPLEYLIAPPTATAGGLTVISAASSSSVAGSSGSVTVAFGSEAGQFSSLNYTTHVGIILPRTIAGIPTYYFALVGAAGVAAVLAVAVATRQLRRAPSDLEFVEEENR